MTDDKCNGVNAETAQNEPSRRDAMKVAHHFSAVVNVFLRRHVPLGTIDYACVHEKSHRDREPNVLSSLTGRTDLCTVSQH
jgi:hypothetical protein